LLAFTSVYLTIITLTKVPQDIGRGLRDRPDSDRQLEKGFLEKIDEFRDGVRQIDERFNNRLSGKEIRFVEDYTDNRFGIIVRLHRAGEPNGEWLTLCIDAHAGGNGNSTPIGTDTVEPIFKLNEVRDNQQEPMLVDIVELTESPNERRFIIPSSVRFYHIKDEGLGLWEGLIYRRVLRSGLIDNNHEVFPRFVSWKGRSRQTQNPGGFTEARPKIVGDTVEIMDSLPRMEEDFRRDGMGWPDGEYGRISVVIDSKKINVVGDRLFNQVFDNANVYLGPFNLEF
jgi:hypothetical protein